MSTYSSLVSNAWFNQLNIDTKILVSNNYNPTTLSAKEVEAIYLKTIPEVVKTKARLYSNLKEDFDFDDERYFQTQKIINFLAYLVGYTENKGYTKDNLLDVMNIGMILRQDQLNGLTDKSGVEMIDEYIKTI